MRDGGKANASSTAATALSATCNIWMSCYNCPSLRGALRGLAEQNFTKMTFHKATEPGPQRFYIFFLAIFRLTFLLLASSYLSKFRPLPLVTCIVLAMVVAPQLSCWRYPFQGVFQNIYAVCLQYFLVIRESFNATCSLLFIRNSYNYLISYILLLYKLK